MRDRSKVTVDRERAALLVVDMQPDFMPGGALAVDEADLLIEPIGRLMTSGLFGRVIATQDWHPPGHISFASSHPGRSPFDVIDLWGREQILWPDHCVQQTPGAALHEALPWGTVSAVVRKGTDPEVDSYSGFRNNWDKHGRRPPTGLAGLLFELGMDQVVIAGLARDFCVRWSAEDARAAGFRTIVPWDLTRAVDPESDQRVRRDLLENGVEITTSELLTT
ncbi:MAG: nicotinamidase [Acidobacteria bacterium]|jgi:nicotinamidase/pyrazinamidase|nr:nicotinamidase [Acidobacteriota bacterium]